MSITRPILPTIICVIGGGKMPRGRKKDTRTSQEKLTDLLSEIENQEALLRELRAKKRALEKSIEDEKKDALFQKIQASGKTIEELLSVL